MKAFVDPDICIGCVLCVKICPGVFKQDNKIAVVYVNSVPKELEEHCKRTIFECPVNAIRNI